MSATFVGTDRGVYRLEGAASEHLGLADSSIRAILTWPDRPDGTILLAGTYGDGLYRSSDGGRRWERVERGLTASAFRCIQPDPLNDGAILAGCEPGRLYRSWDGGQSWRELDGITRTPGHEQWYLPYSPRAGAIRNVWAPPRSRDRLFASVEVGGLLVSEDRGESWRCELVGDDDDIHYVTGHPVDADLVFAALGYATLRYRDQADHGRRFGGVARSRDGGRSWQKLESDYTRAVIVPPTRPELVLAAPAPQVSRQGRIVVSADGGDSWCPASDGIETPMPDMVELFVPGPDGEIWAICSGGRLLCSTAGEWHWRSVALGESGRHVHAVAFSDSG